LDPKFTRAWLLLGIVYMTSEQSDFALDAFRKGIDSDPKQLVARRAYASVLAYLRRSDEAMDAWREALKIVQDDPEANAELAELLVQQTRYAEAVPYAETAAKNDSSQARKPVSDPPICSRGNGRRQAQHLADSWIWI